MLGFTPGFFFCFAIISPLSLPGGILGELIYIGELGLIEDSACPGLRAKLVDLDKLFVYQAPQLVRADRAKHDRRIALCIRLALAIIQSRRHVDRCKRCARVVLALATVTRII